jgi:hypothetical protein
MLRIRETPNRNTHRYRVVVLTSCHYVQSESTIATSNRETDPNCISTRFLNDY